MPTGQFRKNDQGFLKVKSYTAKSAKVRGERQEIQKNLANLAFLAAWRLDHHDFEKALKK